MVLSVCVTVTIMNVWVGGKKGTSTTSTVMTVPRLPLIMVQESDPANLTGAEAVKETYLPPAALPASTHDTPPVIETAHPVGQAGKDIWTDRQWIYEYLERTEQARQQVSLENRITTYMQKTTCSPDLIALVPLMVDLGEQTSMDCRLCAVTAKEESSGGLGSYDLFGTKGYSSIGGTDWETQVRWYFSRIKQISDEHGWGGDVYSIAWFWHGGGSQGTNHDFYAGNITRAVQNI